MNSTLRGEVSFLCAAKEMETSPSLIPIYQAPNGAVNSYMSIWDLQVRSPCDQEVVVGCLVSSLRVYCFLSVRLGW